MLSRERLRVCPAPTVTTEQPQRETCGATPAVPPLNTRGRHQQSRVQASRVPPSPDRRSVLNVADAQPPPDPCALEQARGGGTRAGVFCRLRPVQGQEGHSCDCCHLHLYPSCFCEHQLSLGDRCRVDPVLTRELPRSAPTLPGEAL